MVALQRLQRSAFAVASIGFLASGPGGANLALMAGSAKPGAVAALAAAGVAVVAGIKIFAKAGAAGATKVVVGKGAAGAVAKVGLGTAGTREGLIRLSEHEARDVLTTTARSAFMTRPQLLAPEHFPDLFHKYPQLKAAARDPSAYEAFLAENPAFLDDAAVALYRREPALFERSFAENRLLSLYQDRFGIVVHEQVTQQNGETVRDLLSDVARSLEKKGFPSATLQGMEEKALEKVVEKALLQEIERKLKSAEYKWSYKSGTLSVKGDVGHFSFEQEITLAGLAKGVAIGAAGISGYKIVWSKDAFVQVRSCIDAFCIDLDSKKRTLTAGGDAPSASAPGR